MFTEKRLGRNKAIIQTKTKNQEYKNSTNSINKNLIKTKTSILTKVPESIKQDEFHSDIKAFRKYKDSKIQLNLQIQTDMDLSAILIFIEQSTTSKANILNKNRKTHKKKKYYLHSLSGFVNILRPLIKMLNLTYPLF